MRVTRAGENIFIHWRGHGGRADLLQPHHHQSAGPADIPERATVKLAPASAHSTRVHALSEPTSLWSNRCGGAKENSSAKRDRGRSAGDQRGVPT